MPKIRASTMRNRLPVVALACFHSISSTAGFVPAGTLATTRLATIVPKTRSSACRSSRGSSVTARRYTTILKDAPSAPQDPTSESKPSPFVAIINLFGINEIFRLLFIKYAIAFPASLSGCGALFATFLFAPIGGELYNQFSPGAAVLAKWLPVFFVPSLVSLPLANSVGSAVEVSTSALSLTAVLKTDYLIAWAHAASQDWNYCCRWVFLHPFDDCRFCTRREKNAAKDVGDTRNCACG